MDNNAKDRKVSFLRKVVPFHNLSASDLELVSGRLYPRSYKHKDFIIHQGDTSRDIFIIKKGRVRIMTHNKAGDESCLRLFADGDIFGELSACDSIPRSASAQALGECHLLVMGHTDFLSFLREMPDLSLGFIQFLADKLRWTTLYSHTISQYDTAGRLLHTLLHYKDMLGREIVSGKIYEVDLSLNQTDLASMVGARREWVNRLLQQWRKNELIHYDRGKITILDLPAVEAERDRRMAVFQDETW